MMKSMMKIKMGSPCTTNSRNVCGGLVSSLSSSVLSCYHHQPSIAVSINNPSTLMRERNFSRSSSIKQSTLSVDNVAPSSSSSNQNNGKPASSPGTMSKTLTFLRNLLLGTLKIYAKIVLALTALSLVMYGALRGFLALVHYAQFDNPSSPYYNKDLADKLASPIQLCEGMNRYFKSLMTIYAIAIDYFWLLITEPYNPHYWFVEKPDKTSEEFVKQKKQAHKRNAERLLNLFIEQRGVYIKIGQFLSSLVSAIPDEYIDTLKVLRDGAPTIPFDDVRKVIHQDFGKSIEELFDEFDEKPIAAASIAQVHKARTKDGRLVAVKVQYPFVRSYFGGDMRTNDSMSTLSLKLYYMQEDADNIDALVEMNNKFNTELETGLVSELDFRHEASNAKQAAEHMVGRPDVYVPKIHDDLTSERVLTMEFIEHACTANNVEAIKGMGFKEEDIAERILSAFSDQLFIHGFIQADPHSSNVFVRKNPSKPSEPQLVLLDHGLYKKFDENFRIGYAKFVNSIVMGDEKGMKEYCESLGITDYKMYASMMMMQAYDQLEGGEDYSGKNFEEFNEVVKEQFQGILEIYKKMPADMLFISRADNILRGLNKDLGAKVNRFTIMARSAARGMNINSTTPAPHGIFAQMNEWRRRMYFEFRLYFLAVQSWFIMLYMKIFGMNTETIKLKKEHDHVELLEKEVDLLETSKHISSEYK